MIEDLIRMHTILGIECKKQPNKNRAPFIIINKSRANYSLFSQKIGFDKAIVKAGGNVGKYKQLVLSAVISRMPSI